MTSGFYRVQFRHEDRTYSIDNFALKEDRSSINLLKLFTKQKGTLLRVNSSGYLKEVAGWKAWFKYKWHQKNEDAKLKIIIDEALTQFSDYLSHLKDQKVAHAFAKALFDITSSQGIGRLRKTLYSRELVKCSNALTKYLVPPLPPASVRLQLSQHQFIDIRSNNLPGLKGPDCIHLDLGSATLNHNLWMLLKRKKGQIYQVTGEGKLEKVSNRRKYRWLKEANDLKVQTVVSATLQRLNNVFAKLEMTQVHQLVLEKIFSPNSPLCRMSRTVFKRETIEEGGFLEQRLAPELNAKRNKLVAALLNVNRAKDPNVKNAAKRFMEHALLELTMEEFSFAKRLGIELERNRDGGSGGARYARDRYGKKILVVKPVDEGPGGDNNPQWYARIKRFLVSPKACLDGNSDAMGEYASWLWDRCFGIWSVPPTDIRYVASRDFIGAEYKECSVQMFVDGCQTLGEYVGISPKVQWLPRRFLRWYAGCALDSSPFSSLGQREGRKKELLEKLPTYSVERVAIHNAGIEDTDCHFENILVRVSDPNEKDSLLNQIFEGTRQVSQEEVTNLVKILFKNKGNQALLDHLLFSEEIFVNGERKKINLIKHDGGASSPNAHPSFWDYFSLRNKYLFEVLPHFEQPFSLEAKSLLADKNQIFAHFLLESGVCNLRNIVTDAVYDEFWQHEENRSLLKQWIFETDEDLESTLRLKIVGVCYQAVKKIKKDELRARLLEAHGKVDDSLLKVEMAKFIKEEEKNTLYHFEYHLKRIKGILQSSKESFCVLRKYVNSDDHIRRYFFKNVKSSSDFIREKENLEDGIEGVMKAWKRRAVQIGEAKTPNRRTLSLNPNLVFAQLGEAY